MGNVDDEQHNRCHRELSSSSLPVLFVSKEKKPKPNQDNYEGSLSLSVSTKSYELLIGKRTLTQKMNEFVKSNVCNLGALCWHLQSGVFFDPLFQFSSRKKKKKVFHCPHLSVFSLV